MSCSGTARLQAQRLLAHHVWSAAPGHIPGTLPQGLEGKRALKGRLGGYEAALRRCEEAGCVWAASGSSKRERRLARWRGAQCRKPFDYNGSAVNGTGRFWLGRGIDSGGSAEAVASSTEAAYNPRRDGQFNFQGRLAEMRVWAGVALSQHRIRTYMHMTGATVLQWHPDIPQGLPPGSAPGLVAYWLLDGVAFGAVEAQAGAGKTVPDVAGAGRNATTWFGPLLTPGLEVRGPAASLQRISDRVHPKPYALSPPGHTILR